MRCAALARTAHKSARPASKCWCLCSKASTAAGCPCASSIRASSRTRASVATEPVLASSAPCERSSTCRASRSSSSAASRVPAAHSRCAWPTVSRAAPCHGKGTACTGASATAARTGCGVACMFESGVGGSAADAIEVAGNLAKPGSGGPGCAVPAATAFSPAGFATGCAGCVGAMTCAVFAVNDTGAGDGTGTLATTSAGTTCGIEGAAALGGAGARAPGNRGSAARVTRPMAPNHPIAASSSPANTIAAQSIQPGRRAWRTAPNGRAVTLAVPRVTDVGAAGWTAAPPGTSARRSRSRNILLMTLIDVAPYFASRCGISPLGAARRCLLGNLHAARCGISPLGAARRCSWPRFDQAVPP